VSVVIPTFNRSDLVSRAVESALRQRTPPLEVVVADDGSSDATLELLQEKFRGEPLLRILALPHRGASAARNAAARVARGGFLAFLDSDDELEADWLSSLMSAVADGVGLVRSDGTVHVDDGEQYRSGSPGWRGHYPTGAVGSGTWAVAGEAFAAVGGYDERLTFSENTELLIRLSKHCSAVGLSMIERTDAHVVIHRRSGRELEYGLGPGLAAERMLREHADVFAGDAELRQQYWAIVGTGRIRAGRRAPAIAAFVRSWSARPAALVPAARLARAALVPRRRSS
jgi:hypothetical protein